MRQWEVCRHQVCDHCGGRFGMVTHRRWGNKFCKRAYKSAHRRENHQTQSGWVIPRFFTFAGGACLAAAVAVATRAEYLGWLHCRQINEFVDHCAWMASQADSRVADATGGTAAASTAGFCSAHAAPVLVEHVQALQSILVSKRLDLPASSRMMDHAGHNQ
jgi:hypothetical protein